MKLAEPGLVHESEVMARPEDLASALGNTGVDVVSSPATIGFLEMACVAAIKHLYEDGEASVGVGFNMLHVGAATPDMPVSLRVELIEVVGKRLTFKVLASQAGLDIMTGTHQRAVVDLVRLLEGVHARKPA